MVVKSFGKEHEVKINTSHYANNENFALLLEYTDGEPFAVLTVNLGEKLPEYYAYVDTNNCPWAIEFLAKYHLGLPVGRAKVSGFCVYQLYHFNKNIIERYMNQ